MSRKRPFRSDSTPPELNNKQRSTLAAIFEEPTRANIPWRDIEALFRALGATVREGRGSRVRVLCHGEIGLFHEPHPEREASKPLVRSVRRYLQTLGVQP